MFSAQGSSRSAQLKKIRGDVGEDSKERGGEGDDDDDHHHHDGDKLLMSTVLVRPKNRTENGGSSTVRMAGVQ
jgi:hypothetical protein